MASGSGFKELRVTVQEAMVVKTSPHTRAAFLCVRQSGGGKVESVERGQGWGQYTGEAASVHAWDRREMISSWN